MLKKELDLQKLPSNARFSIFDSTYMYTHIRKGPSLHYIVHFTLANDKQLTVPPVVLMNALRLLMKITVF